MEATTQTQKIDEVCTNDVCRHCYHKKCEKVLQQKKGFDIAGCKARTTETVYSFC